ncbi:DNA repair protein RecO C-terminal domain-containing protein [Spiroplasma endosymbiont of Virgichneumon dumeticola]|uniref:DNA repair protein RecO C-terminal domain-containing protein n=1 Tax=Spiroplasma endosymbiont of Virgichneumon dumeticola TaxID=3139323 RepID=UPI0035C882E4
MFHTLSLQGIQFNFKNCINCGANSSIIDFNSQLGGIICYNCFGPSLVITNNLPLFNTLMKLNNINNWKITQKELKYIINILEFHCQTYSGIPIIRINKYL